MTEVVTLADRRAVYALLQRMLDWLPAAPLALPRPEPTAAVKPGEGRWRRCTRCAGTGRMTGEGRTATPCRRPHEVTLNPGVELRERTVPAPWPYGHGCRPCDSCAHGWVKLPIVTRQGLPGVDPMLNAGKTEFATDADERAERRRWVDGQLVKLEALFEQHAGREAADDDHTRASKRKAGLYKRGSFAELELALDALAIAYPGAHAAVVFWCVEEQFPPDDEMRAALDEIVDWIAIRIRAMLGSRDLMLPADANADVAAWKHSLEHGRTAEHRRLREHRDAEIVGLVEAHGWSLRRVGRHYDLSHVAVLGIVRKARAGEVAAVASGPAA